MINVVGKTLDVAKKALEDLKLKVEVEYSEDTTKPNGQVLGQNTVSGTVVDEGSTIVLTVNQIAQIKSGTVNINLKQIAKEQGYIVEEVKDEDGKVTDKVSKVKVVVKVTSDGAENTVYSREILASEEKVSVKVSGKGTIKIEVNIDDLYRVEQLDLNKENPTVTISE